MSEAVKAVALALYDLENQGPSACPFDELPQGELAARLEMAAVAVNAAVPHLLGTRVADE